MKNQFVNLATGNYFSVLDVIKSSEIITNKKIWTACDFVGKKKARRSTKALFKIKSC